MNGEEDGGNPTGEELPQVYVACSLTHLEGDSRQAVAAQVALIERTILDLTVSLRVKGEEWPIKVHAPIRVSAPWATAAMSPSAVFRQNFIALQESDALIVHGQRGSVGVGQEIEWATRLGLPTLYLSTDGRTSRQLAGGPGFVTVVNCQDDQDKLIHGVEDFLRHWKPQIVDGPRRRRSRRLRFQPLTLRLKAAWAASSDPTLAAAQCQLSVQQVELFLERPDHLAGIGLDSLLSLCNALGVDLDAAFGPPLSRGQSRLPISATRALFAAATREGWHDDIIENLMIRAAERSRTGARPDLDTIDAWIRLRGEAA